MIAEYNPFYALFRTHKQELEQQLIDDPNTCRMWLSRTVVPQINRQPGTTIVINNYTVAGEVAGEVAVVFAEDEGNISRNMKK